jgi:hypothetical protein
MGGFVWHRIEVLRMRLGAVCALGMVGLLTGCSFQGVSTVLAVPTVSNVIPSATGTPLAVTAFGAYEFVSIEGTGQIFTYDVARGTQQLVGAPYQAPCMVPAGMGVATVSGSHVMAVTCYDTGTVVTLSVHGDGSLSALGTVGGLVLPYLGMAVDGTNVLVPLFGRGSGVGSGPSSGGVVKISIASPANPVVTGVATLTAPLPGGYANASFLTVAGGYIYVASGSESAPLSASSTVQVVDEATMTVVGTPLVVAHSPQQITVSGSVAYVSIFDSTQLEAIDVSHPASLTVLDILPLVGAGAGCNGLPVAVSGKYVYVGCYGQGVVEVVDASNPANLTEVQTIGGIGDSQSFAQAGEFLFVTSSVGGGEVYQINLGDLGLQ